MDPQASYDLKEAMRNHAKEGNSVLFSTHVLSVAEQLCDRIAILKKGKLIFQGSLAELKSQYPDKDLETFIWKWLDVRLRRYSHELEPCLGAF